MVSEALLCKNQKENQKIVSVKDSYILVETKTI